MSSAVALRAPARRRLGGHLPAFRRDPLDFLTRCAREYGDFVPLRFGPYPMLLVNQPEAIQDVLVTHHRSFVKSRTNRVLSRLLGDGLLTSDGELWRRERQILQPAFHHDRLGAYGQLMVRGALRAIESWQAGQTRDITRDMAALTLRIVDEAILGAELALAVDELTSGLTRAQRQFEAQRNSPLVAAGLEIVFRLPLRLRWLLLPRLGRLDAFIRQIVRRRRAAGEDAGDDVIGLLLRARTEAGQPLSDRQIRDEVVTLMVAGHETTSLALGWAWYLLAQAPATEAALHEELDRVLGDRAVEPHDLPRLAYTRAVIDEAMRLYPPAWIIMRTAVEDCSIGGQPLRRGTTVILSPWVTHRDARLFPDADRFRAERWLNGLEEQLPRFAYFPFGGGPRRCIGHAFARMEAELVLATIAQRYRLDLQPGQNVVPWPAVTLRSRHPIQMIVHARRAPSTHS